MTAPLTDEEIAALDASRAKATQGTWIVPGADWPGPSYVTIGTTDGETVLFEDDGFGSSAMVLLDVDRDHIIAAVNACPRLIAEVRRLREEVARMREDFRIGLDCGATLTTETNRLRRERDDALAEVRRLREENAGLIVEIKEKEMAFVLARADAIGLQRVVDVARATVSTYCNDAGTTQLLRAVEAYDATQRDAP